MKLKVLKSIREISEQNFEKISNDIYQFTLNLYDYPTYKNLYFNKQIPGIISGERDILFVRYNNKIIAAICLKKTRDEKKICMIYFCKKYRNQGIGTKIIEQSFNYLETKKPLITLPDYKIEMFKPLIKKYNWQLSEVLDNFYNNRSKELCFNGTLARK